MRIVRLGLQVAMVAILLAVARSNSQALAVSVDDEVASHPTWDQEYTKLIREATTDKQFLTDLVNYLPSSKTVPSPLKFNGYIAGAPDKLTYAARIHEYMHAVAAASPRVKVFSIGKTEEGREMILVAVADEATIASLERFKDVTRALADPRKLSDERAQALIATGKPLYYVTGGLHSGETGSPEMLQELVYRLAVDDSPMISSIRNNIITIITPVLEVDGRERQVDAVRYFQKNPESGMPPLVYWGKYVGHDNNRDAVGMALALTRNLMGAYAEWHPQVMHDLHESIPFLYVSTGTGPYNAWLDPLMIAEWERMAINEVQILTAKGLPGVWTHGFYDGWAPNYLFWVAMGRNSIGRFYETYGNSVPSTEDRVVRGSSDRAWYRPNPPLPKVRWSLRNNVNYQQSGVLLALADMAANPKRYLDQFYSFGKRSVAKARTEGPAAYVFDGNQKRQGQLFDLMKLMIAHGVEVQVADKAFSLKPGWPPPKPKKDDAKADKGAVSKPREAEKKAGDDKAAKADDDLLSFPVGSFIIRLDQPYSRLVDALLDTQYVRGDERVYDDTGWTLGYARNLQCKRIVNTEVLAVPAHAFEVVAKASTASSDPKGWVAGAVLLVENAADTDLARLRFVLPKVRMLVAEDAFDGDKQPAGTVLIPIDEGNQKDLASALTKLHLRLEVKPTMPIVATHELRAPRIGLLHTWSNTQDEGWYRLALEEMGVPYTYLSIQALAKEPKLRDRFDVLLFPPGSGRGEELINGYPAGPPVPWKKSELTPNFAIDETDDIRPGMGIAGFASLVHFVEDGGLLIATSDSAAFAVESGLVRYVSVVKPTSLKSRGSLLLASVRDRRNPITYGYDETLPVYFDGDMVFRVGMGERHDRSGERPSGRGGKNDPDVPQGRPYMPLPAEPEVKPSDEGFPLPEEMAAVWKMYRPSVEQRPKIVVAFSKEGDNLLLSGMLSGGEEIAGKPIIIDCPRGNGHVLLYANNPMWRANSQGSYALVLNAVMSFDNLSPRANADK